MTYYYLEQSFLTCLGSQQLFLNYLIRHWVELYCGEVQFFSLCNAWIHCFTLNLSISVLVLLEMIFNLHRLLGPRKHCSRKNLLWHDHQEKTFFRVHAEFRLTITLCRNFRLTSTFPRSHVFHHLYSTLYINFLIPRQKYQDHIFYHFGTHLHMSYNLINFISFSTYPFHVSFRLWIHLRRLKYFSIYTNQNHGAYPQSISLCKYQY